MRILVTDGQLRKTLAAVRSLGAAGHQVWVAEDTPIALARFSRWATGALRSPPLGDVARLSDWLRGVVRAYGIELVMPMDDESTEAAIQLGDAAGALSLVPGSDQFQIFRDKARTMAQAAEAGVAVPAWQAVTSDADLEDAFQRWPAGFILRPRRGGGGRGVALVRSFVQARQALDRWAAAGGGMLAQELIRVGGKWDVGLLYDQQGELAASFVQQELRWYPEPYGTSTVQVSASRSDLVAVARRLVESVGWHGPVEVEFLQDRDDGRVWLAEVNPRYWASLALAIEAGVDFPLLAADLARGAGAGAAPSYRPGLACRWSMPADVLHWLAHPRRWLGARDLPAGIERLTDDIWSTQDLGPTVAFPLIAASLALRPQMWRMLFRW